MSNSIAVAGLIAVLGLLFPTLSLAADSSKAAGARPSPSSPLSPDERRKYDEAIDLINSYAGKGDHYQRAFGMLAELAKANPQSGFPYGGLAELKFQLFVNGREGSPQEIRALVGKALSLDPDCVGAYVVQAKLALHENKIAEAQNAIHAASLLAASNPEVMFVEARVAEKLGQFNEAEKWYRRTIESMTNPARKSNIYGWLAEMLLKKKPPDIPNAHAAMRSEVDLAPNQPWKLINYASFLNKYTNDYETAIDYASRALKLGDVGGARLNLAIAMYAKWADAFLHPAKVKPGSTAAPGPKAIHAKTGVSPEYVFVIAAAIKAKTYVSAALLKAEVIRDPDTVPPGYCCTALLGASFSGDLQLASMLIERGANVNAQDRERGGTALFNFIIDRNIQAVDLLLSKGARLNQLANEGNTPLHVAVNAESDDPKLPITRLLLKRGADPAIPNRDGLSLLAYALNGYPAALRLLVNEYKADPNTKLPDGHAALARAATGYYGERGIEMVRILIEAGANPWVTWRGVDVVQTLTSPQYLNYQPAAKNTALIQAARRNVPKPADFAEFSPAAGVTK